VTISRKFLEMKKNKIKVSILSATIRSKIGWTLQLGVWKVQF
jgi:hypothetical protein